MEMPKHGQFCWMELATTDLEVCKTFYAEMFGWEFKGSPNAETKVEYPEFGFPNSYPMGGMMKMSPEMYGGHTPPPHWGSYIAVDDCDASAAKCKELGGKVCAEPFEIPNVGRMSVVQDPTGATFSLIKLKQM